jgi:fibronectin type 3 domain-containing protein
MMFSSTLCTGLRRWSLLGLLALLAAIGFMSTSRPGAIRTATETAKSREDAVKRAFLRTPMMFEASGKSKGSAVRFAAKGPGYNVLITPKEAVLALFKGPKAAAKSKANNVRLLRLGLIGSNPNPKVASTRKLKAKTNYLLGNDPKSWRRNVENYRGVRYDGVYPGIDLVYYGNQQQLEYDFIVKSGADPSQIALKFDGADKVEIDPTGELVVSMGEETLREHRPVVYQNVDGERQPVEGRYVKRDERTVGFEVAKYDASRTLVIDPVLSYSTLLGGTLDDYGMAVSTDAQGVMYVTGYTASCLQDQQNAPNPFPPLPKITPFPTTIPHLSINHITPAEPDPDRVQTPVDLNGDGSPDVIFSESFYDAFVAKIDPTPRQLDPDDPDDDPDPEDEGLFDHILYSTYLGGYYADDYGTCISVRDGEAYVGGMTRAKNFPIIGGVQSRNGGEADGFVARIVASGDAVVYSTYVGGEGSDWVRALAIDSRGNCAITGFTSSPVLPVVNAIQPNFNGGARDQFVASLNVNGRSWNFLTYLGGAADEGGIGPVHGVAPYRFGFPHPPLGSLPYGEDFGAGVAIGPADNIYVTGATTSADFPVTADASRGAKGGPDEDAFLSTLDPAGLLLYSSYVGGTGDDGGRGIAVGVTGEPTIAGYTNSADYETTSNAVQTTVAGGRDAFLMTLDSGGKNLVYSTLLGGSGDDIPNQLAINSDGAVLMIGTTDSPDLPVVVPLQPGLRGSQDAFIAKVLPSTGTLEYLTYLGGDFADQGMSISLDLLGRAYISGITHDTYNRFGVSTFPATGINGGGLIQAYQPLMIYPSYGAGTARRTLQLGSPAPPSAYGPYPYVDAWAGRITNPPNAPTNLRYTRLLHNLVDLAWNDNSSNETSFELERADGGGLFNLIATLGPDTTTFTDAPLQPSSVYSYRVRSVSGDGESAYSNVLVITTLPEPPPAPPNLRVNAPRTLAVDVAWDDASTLETEYRLYRATGAGMFTEIAVLGANTTGYSDTSDIAAETTYRYKVVAFNGASASPDSNIASVTTLAAPDTVAVSTPAPPAGRTTLTVTWKDNSANEGGYRIERSSDDVTYTQVGTVGANVTTFNAGGLTPNTTYWFKVRAASANAFSDYSASASGKTLRERPAAPTELTVTTPPPPDGITKLNLAWKDNATDEDGYRVERAKGVGGAFAPIEDLPANSTSYGDSGLEPETTYAYRVFAYNSGGDSDSSNIATGMTLPLPPLAPSELKVTVPAPPDGITTLVLNWKDNSDKEDGFKVERALGDGGFEEIDRTDANVTTYTSGGLDPLTTYRFRVRAFNTGGDSDYSNIASGTTLPTPPADPTALALTVLDGDTFRLDWSDNSDNEVGFSIERDDDAAGFQEVATVDMNVETYTDDNLRPDTTFRYRVRAFNTGGPSQRYTNIVTGTTAPTPPSNLVITSVTNSEVHIFWVDNSDKETGYKVERRTGEEDWSEVASLPADSTDWADSDVEASTSYDYRVYAFNAVGNSGYSNVVTATTLPNPPNAPSELTATATSQTDIQLTWRDNSTTETRFEVQRSTDGGANFTLLASLGTNTTSYLDSGLTANTTYQYKVRAENAGGLSDFSNIASATTRPPAPAAPSGLTVKVISAHELSLSWVDNSNNETEFRIERKGAGDPFHQIATTAGTKYDDRGLKPNKTYAYRVRAANSGGASAFSNVARGLTLPAAPSSVDATANSKSRITVTWKQKGGADGFRIERKSEGSSFRQIARVGGGSNTYVDSGLIPGRRYSYRLRAFNGSGLSEYSATASARTKGGGK